VSDSELALIASSGLAPANMVSAVLAISQELEQTHRTAQVLRTRTEMEVSVLNDLKHPTPDSKYWQSVREQDVQLGELIALSFAHQKHLIEIRRIDEKLTAAVGLDAELLAVELREAEWIAEQQRRTAFHRCREIMEWSAIKAELAPHCIHSLENVEEHQLPSMVVRYAAQVASLSPSSSVPERVNAEGLAATSHRVMEESR
jgi:hypothetical protein